MQWSMRNVRLPGMYFRVLMHSGRKVFELFRHIKDNGKLPDWVMIEGHVELPFIIEAVDQWYKLRWFRIPTHCCVYSEEEHPRVCEQGFVYLYHLAIGTYAKEIPGGTEKATELADRDYEGGKAVEYWLTARSRLLDAEVALEYEYERLKEGDDDE